MPNVSTYHWDTTGTNYHWDTTGTNYHWDPTGTITIQEEARPDYNALREQLRAFADAARVPEMEPIGINVGRMRGVWRTFKHSVPQNYGEEDDA